MDGQTIYNTQIKWGHMMISPARKSIEESYNIAMERLNGGMHGHNTIAFAQGVLWGIRRPDLSGRMKSIDCVADFLEEIWQGSSPMAEDRNVRYAFTLICDYVSWELSEGDPRKGI